MKALVFCINVFCVDTVDRRSGTGKIFINQIFTDTEGFKNLSAVVAADGGNPHFRENFQQSFVDGMDVVFTGLTVSQRQFVAFYQMVDGGESQIGVYHAGAVAQQQGKMVHFTGFAGFHNNPHLHSFFLSDEVVVHGRHGQQRRERGHLPADGPVGKNDKVFTVIHGFFGGQEHPVKCLLKSFLSAAGREKHGNDSMGKKAVFEVFYLSQVGVGDDGFGKFNEPAMLGAFG